MTKSYMRNLLDEVEETHLPALLLQHHKWSSVYVDYEPPFVERVWTQLDTEHRVFLHRVAPCDPGQALWHPHPWPSIVKVMPGSSYEQGIGYDSAGTGSCPVGMIQEVHGCMIYEMPSPHSWHYVRPLFPTWSLMITGKPFASPSPGLVRPTKALQPLSDQRKNEIIDYWASHFLMVL